MSSHLITKLTPANLSLTDTYPINQDYQDIYFNPKQPIEESHYVFIQHNQLPQRLSQHSGSFHILETGFGTGLNFLLAANLFINQCQHNSALKHLHFISVEKHPIDKPQLIETLRYLCQHTSLDRPFMHTVIDRLDQHYPPPVPGFYRIIWPELNITLTLLWQDIDLALPELNAHIHCFFLDGFAPSKNPDMWSDTLFQQLARLAYPNATFATFTAASQVRKGLIKAGFCVEKTAGFQHKREMLIGHWPQPSKPQETTPFNKMITIIGAGISGCVTARRLAEAGYQVQLVDEAPDILAGASGNPAAANFMPLPIFTGHFNQLQQASFTFANANMLHLAGCPAAFSATGLIHFPANDRDHKRFNNIRQHRLWPSEWQHPVDGITASDIAHVPIAASGMYYPTAHLVEARILCQHLSQHPNIHLRLNRQVHPLIPENPQRDLMPSDSPVILCTAYHTCSLVPFLQLPLIPIRGQLTYLSPTPVSQHLRTMLSGKAYLLPTQRNSNAHILGATYHPHNQDVTVTTQDHATNLDYLNQLCPEIAQAYSPTAAFEGRASVRSQSRDYFPILGPSKGSTEPNVWLNCGLGSRGFTHAWICADILLSYLTGSPFCVPETLRMALHPDRFSK